MNRANLGNVITNGMQILSVGSTTASRLFSHERNLGQAQNTLNNVNKQQSQQEKIMGNLTEEEQQKYYKMKADKRKEEVEKWENKPKTFAIEENSEQAKALNDRFANDNEWQKTLGVRFTNKATGQMVSLENALKLINNKGEN